MDTKPLSFGKLDIGYFMENSSALFSGIRNFGQVWDGTSERGFFDPLKSKVNSISNLPKLNGFVSISHMCG
jgi:hypothetical protein